MNDETKRRADLALMDAMRASATVVVRTPGRTSWLTPAADPCSWEHLYRGECLELVTMRGEAPDAVCVAALGTARVVRKRAAIVAAQSREAG